MNDYLKEMCLCDYFMLRIIMKNKAFDGKSVFKRLAKIYLLTKKQADELYAEAEHADVAEISNKHAYDRYKRMRSFGALMAETAPAPDPRGETIDIKGGVIAGLDAAEFFKAGDSPQAVRNYLSETAAAGSVPLMRVIGFMKVEGLLFDKNTDDGIRLIRDAAEWNNAEAMFMLLHYGVGDRAELMGALEYALERASKGSAFAAARKAYGEPGKRSDARVLLESCFSSGALHRSAYSAPHAEIIRSKILPIQDKRELLSVTDARVLRSQVATIPLGLDPELRPECDGASTAAFGYMRESVPALVEQWLSTAAYDSPAFRPLCFCSDSSYILNACAAALEKCLCGAHIERIYIGELENVDFAPATHNVFIASCDQSAPNVYFMYFRGEVSSDNFDRAKSFLKWRYRQNFKIDNPSIKLDLSCILPVCFCEPLYLSRLGKSCDVIKITEPTRAEKEAIIAEMLRHRAETLKIPSLALADGVIDKLVELGVDEINKVLATVSRRILIKKNTQALITLDAIDEVRRETLTSDGGFGFGGYDYDIK